MTALTLCLDFEASGIGQHTFPIEVAVADPTSGEVQSWLIRPTPEWLAVGVWDKAAEAVHGLTVERITAEGLSVEQVTEALTNVAYGARVLSDSPGHDGHWLRTLYSATGVNNPPFALQDFHHFAWACATRVGRRPDIAFVKAETEAAVRFPVTHRAGADARHNAEILRQLSG